MLLEIKSVETKDRLNRKFVHDLFVLKCDVCYRIWEQRGAKSRLCKTSHICSKECKKLANKRGGCINKRRTETCKQKYGVELPSNLCEFREKQKATMRERYGVEFPMQMQSVKNALISGSMAKYGTEYPMQNKEFAMQVMIKRSQGLTFYQSKSEEKFFKFLCQNFESIQRQVLMNKFWCIDFFLPLENTFIQFDGVYWHALDKPIEEIKKSSKIRDKSRYRKWLVDRQQDKWFRDQNFRLIRITDLEFKKSSQDCLMKIRGV